MNHIVVHNLLARAGSDVLRYGRIALDTAADLFELGIDVSEVEQTLIDHKGTDGCKEALHARCNESGDPELSEDYET